MPGYQAKNSFLSSSCMCSNGSRSSLRLLTCSNIAQNTFSPVVSNSLSQHPYSPEVGVAQVPKALPSTPHPQPDHSAPLTQRELRAQQLRHIPRKRQGCWGRRFIQDKTAMAESMEARGPGGGKGKQRGVGGAAGRPGCCQEGAGNSTQQPNIPFQQAVFSRVCGFICVELSDHSYG